MSALRLKIIRICTLAAFILITGNGFLYSQLEITLPSLSPIIDTSDYFPDVYPEALDNNLMIAASKGYTSEIKRLIAKGANINAETSEGATPLIFAIKANSLFTVITLLEYHPVLDNITQSFETPLLIAVKSGYFEITEALIRAGADMEYTDNHGATPLHFAALYGYFNIVDLFMYYNAPVDLKTDEGTTPLLAAIWAGNTDIADLLIQNGAQTEAADNEGFTPFILAAFYGDTIIMDILYKKGANIYATNKAKHNALTIAISKGDNITTEYLLKKGNNWDDPALNAWDPYIVASKYRRNEMVSLLKQYSVPGELKHAIDQFSVTASTRFFPHDIYAGLSLSFKEPNLNGGFTFGCDMKLWYSRLLVKESENSFYQYMDKESVAYAGVFKDFALTDYIDRFNFSLSTSLYAGYSFGNTLKGTTIPTGNKVRVMPAVSLKMTKHNLSFVGGLEYVKTDFYHNGPIWLRLGVAYNYYFDNVRIKVKPIKWN